MFDYANAEQARHGFGDIENLAWSTKGSFRQTKINFTKPHDFVKALPTSKAPVTATKWSQANNNARLLIILEKSTNLHVFMYLIMHPSTKPK